jgi:methyl-accepting chemotaxis protein
VNIQLARKERGVSARIGTKRRQHTASWWPIQLTYRAREPIQKNAAAVAEQAKTTREISLTANEASTRSRDVAANVNSVSEAARSSTQAAAGTTGTANWFSKLSERLNHAVFKFKLDDPRAARQASNPRGKPSRPSAKFRAGTTTNRWDPGSNATRQQTHFKLSQRANRGSSNYDKVR